MTESRTEPVAGGGIGGGASEFALLRGEFAELRGEFGELRGELRELRGELRAEVGSIRGEMKSLATNRAVVLANVGSMVGVATLVLAAARFA